MQIQINAATRLVTAANAADAGKIVLWVQKAIPGAKYKKYGKAGDREGVEFKIGKGKDLVNLRVLLDRGVEPAALFISGDWNGSRVAWTAEEKTGRQTIMAFKEQLKKTVAKYKDMESAAGMVKTLQALIKAKSKIETE